MDGDGDVVSLFGCDEVKITENGRGKVRRKTGAVTPNNSYGV